MELYDLSYILYGGYMPQECYSYNCLTPEKQHSTSRRPARELDFRMKYKTEVCRNWENGFCEFGDRCAFAHGYDELRQKTHLAGNYKTKPCKQFFELGYCMYGPRCQFKHRLEDSSPNTASSSPTQSTEVSRKNSYDATPRKRLQIFVELEQSGSSEE